MSDLSPTSPAPTPRHDPGWWTRLRGWIRRPDILLLAAVLAVVGGTWAFLHLLDEVHEGDTERFDRWAIQTIGGYEAPHWLEEVGRDITALGGMAVLTIVVAGVAGYLLLDRKYHALVLLLVATVGGLLLSLGLKHMIDRPRPDLVPHRSYVMTTSFPSGHAMLSATTYLTLGTLLARLTKSKVLKVYFVAAAMLLTGLVGVSRVFMAVHWPTDVMAGWSAGLVWAIGCWIVARWLQHRGKVESPM
jgi:undecaprenyl-diphosphatase